MVNLKRVLQTNKWIIVNINSRRVTTTNLWEDQTRRYFTRTCGKYINTTYVPLWDQLWEKI